MSLLSWTLLVVASFLAGTVNSVAGGGTLLTFPTLLSAGIPPIVANATSTVALVPGSFGAFLGYGDERKAAQAELLTLGLPSVVGGILGAVVVMRVGDRSFAKLVPFLLYGATALFLVQPLVKRALEGRTSRLPRFVLPIFQLLVATYGGFFGAGIGILMLAAMGIVLAGASIHRLNAFKNLAAATINGVAAVTFALAGRVNWRVAGVMAVAALSGGYLGAGIAKRLGERVVRGFVVLVGLAIGTWLLVKRP